MNKTDRVLVAFAEFLQRVAARVVAVVRLRVLKREIRGRK